MTRTTSSGSSRRGAWSLVITALACSTGVANAQGDPLAPLPPAAPIEASVTPAPTTPAVPTAVLVERAIRLREAGRDIDALPLLQQALAQEPSPRTTAQLGLCEQALGRWVDAQAHLQAALAATTDPWIRQRRAPLTAALASVEEQLGTLEILDGVPGARVRLGGRPIGTLPMNGPATVVVGRATLEILADGYVPYVVEITVRAGELTRQSVALVELPPAPTPVEVARAMPMDQAGASTLDRTSAEDASDHEPLRTKWWLWTIVGVVAAGATGAIVAVTHDPGVESPIHGTAGVAQALSPRW